jgi:hypothetical protein
VYFVLSEGEDQVSSIITTITITHTTPSHTHHHHTHITITHITIKHTSPPQTSPSHTHHHHTHITITHTSPSHTHHHHTHTHHHQTHITTTHIIITISITWYVQPVLPVEVVRNSTSVHLAQSLQLERLRRVREQGSGVREGQGWWGMVE